MKHLQDQPVLILGLGLSGLAMARWCARHGAQVTVADTREAPALLETLRAEWPQATFIGGPFSASLIEGTAIRAVYRSPGLAPATIAPVVDAARAIGLPVGGELDLFAQALHDLRAVDLPLEEPAAVSGDSVEAETETETEIEDELAEPVDPSPMAEAIEPESEPEPVSEPTPPVVVASVPVVPAKASVHTAARDAAEFVARIAELSTAAPAAAAAPGDEKPLPIAAPEPAPAQGYRPAVLAITGTNGKTTVTALTGQLVERAGKTVAVAGNIGPTLLDTLAAHMDAGTLPQVWVLELSSFQLDGVQHFEPTAAAVLNLTQDHLDWHGDMTAYAAAKARIFGTRGPMVLNRDDAAVMQMLPAPVRVKLQRPQQRTHITFGAGMPLRPGDFGIERINGMAWLVRALEADETIKRKRGGPVEEVEIHLQRLLPADALRIRGQHNALNALAALALASAADCALGPMLYGLREYRGEPHRVEPVAIVDEVEYFDDSKGTNVGATVAALSGLGAERRIVVILGGEGKGQDFTPLAAPVRQFARAVVLIGRDAPILEEALAGTGVSLLHAGSMEEAVQAAAQRANPGDAVLLSPACASFDMFKDYAHRAAAFCEAVQSLADAPEGQQP
ncbi:UDP-N-acetylmuramoyl-L-alanine--D-glutamate ligase [Variovorax sp. J22G21]|uniref:UDP-N-acetylmuramoyl-L-alanine--D-glutamate ligase n=1 Tax=Variovorax fucosicus TaxID=3053517 RepID=UPI0025784298|nr:MULTISPECIES: UDP-N-acetylmuramoyl-L-alanine--D-glutamate ligase [unclassified Variovorax]MDM0038405.1 UDP-N-acetylmuramoyl-L-alanine--D-glutamate ligase [Variovorax sp. J22R193]MDM0063181.1 UDP-N-acetylmuramoyl-L-alanine--D-glutamate ligase [Variovorax sp. J22G21]